jgi:hypothetical protein
MGQDPNIEFDEHRPQEEKNSNKKDFLGVGSKF